MALTARDYAEIKQASARFCHSIDFGDLGGLVQCFAPDEGFETPADPPAESSAPGAIPEAYASRIMPLRLGIRDGKGHTRHTPLGVMIDGDGATARALWSVILSRDLGVPAGTRRATSSLPLGTGFYADDLVKHAGRWVFASRRFFWDWSADAGKLVGKPLEIQPVDAGEIRTEMTALDYEAIRQLLTRCGYTLGFEDYDGFADCFTPDGYYSVAVDQEGHPECRLRARGRRQLWQFAVDGTEDGLHGHVRHTALSPLIEGDGRRALVSSYALVTHDFGGPAHPKQRVNSGVLFTGIYRDEVVKVDGRWLLSRRTFRKDTVSDVDALVGKPLKVEPFDD